MTVVWSIVGLVAAGSAGYVVGRRYLRSPLPLVAVAVAVLIVTAWIVFDALVSGEKARSIIALSTGFGAVNGLRYGGGILGALLAPPGSHPAQQGVQGVGSEVDTDA